jgi:hypothetical protein
MELQIIEKNGKRVLTSAQLAKAYETESKIINRNFQRNSDRYLEGKHYFALTGEHLKEFKGSRQFDVSLKYTSVLYLWTEKGAWLHAKSLNSDEAWDAYESLVDDYYTVKQQVRVLSEREQLKESLKLTIETSEKVDKIESKVYLLEQKVEQQITLDHGEQRRIQKAIGHKVYELENDQDVRSQLFRELHREIKDRFAVASYKDIKRKDLLSAIRYIEAWVPRMVS